MIASREKFAEKLLLLGYSKYQLRLELYTPHKQGMLLHNDAFQRFELTHIEGMYQGYKLFQGENT